MTYLWIGIGSALGGMGRYWCSDIATRYFGESFPWGTIIVNVCGSLVIGFLAALTTADGRLLVPEDGRAFLMIGVCGGYTTFSTFSLQTLNLIRNGEWLWASANVVLSVTLCLLAVWLGYVSAGAVSR
jgi:fluoride exporter